MKKILNPIKKIVSRVSHSPKARKVALLLVVFIIGGVVGGVVTDKYIAKDGSKKSTSDAFRTPRTAEDIAKRQSEQLDENYKRAKETVAKDLKEGDLTKDQSEKLLKKIDEIYNYRTKDLKDLPVADARKKLSEKRSEWRKWATDNKISSRYIIRLTI